jgi:hypothetical protein
MRKKGDNIHALMVAFHGRGEFPVVPEFKGRGMPKLATPVSPEMSPPRLLSSDFSAKNLTWVGASDTLRHFENTPTPIFGKYPFHFQVDAY